MLTPWSLNKIFLLLFACLLFAVLGTKPRALHMLSEHSTTRLYPQQNEIFLTETLASQLFSCNSLRAPPISEVLTVHWMNACLANVRSTHAKNQGLQKRTNKKPEWCNIALAFGNVRQVHEQLRQVWIELLRIEVVPHTLFCWVCTQACTCLALTTEMVNSVFCFFFF